jgi:hypothetical protein
MIADVETTFDEVTVDSAPVGSKKELGTRWPMLIQHGLRCTSVILRRLVMIRRPCIAAELPLPRAAASIESP